MKTSLLLKALLLGLAAVCVVPAARSQPVLVENFEEIPEGPLNGQRGWSATLAEVKADPAQTGNRAASFEGAGAAGANLPLSIPEGTTATLFFRMYSEADTTLVDFFAGMSDVAVTGVGVFGDYEAQIGYSGSQILDTLRVRDGSTGANEAAGEFLPRTWYKIWAVIDNAADVYEVFIQGGSFAQQTQVMATSSGNTLFVFRNSGGGPSGDDLIRFFVKSGTAALPGPALLDDVYLAPGRDLTDPVPDLNAAPVVTITEPTDGATFSAPATIGIAVNATDDGGNVTNVAFLVDGMPIGSRTSSPFTFEWTGVAAGFYTLTARAMDADGGTGFSRSLTVTVEPSGTNNFVLRDGFESATPGDLDGQNGWTAAGARVVVDPTQSTNLVASFEGPGGASLPALVPDGSTGTVFFRVFSVADTPAIDWCAGMSDVSSAAPGGPYGDFEAQVCVAGAQSVDRVRAYEGLAATSVDIGEFRPRTWYKVWLVIDNTIDQMEVYMQGGGLTEPTLLEWPDFGYTSFVFRNSGLGAVANDLVRFLILTSGAHSGPFVMDDLYVDSFGRNLSDPVGDLPVLPSVQITAPADGGTFTAPGPITLSAEASRAGGAISEVEFFAGPTRIGADTTSPYSITWSNVTAGIHRLTARATDDQGASQVSAAVSITVNPGAGMTGFQLIEDFEQTTSGDLNGQRGWTATLAQVKADPAQPGNQVASFEGAGAAGANLPVFIPDATTATLFFRMYSEADTTLNDFFAGMSDVEVAGLGVFNDYEAQIGYSGSQILDTLRVRDGSTGANEAAGEFLPRTWYKIWAVIDNAADTYEVFIEGGAFDEQTQVMATSTGSTSFVFRNSGGGPEANHLVRFLVKSGTAALPGPALLDDVYLATGRELSDPVGDTVLLRLEVSRVGGAVTLTWEGTAVLQSSPSVAGGYADVAGAQSPLQVDTSAASQTFYRLRQ
jgi:hypothetical protein